MTLTSAPSGSAEQSSRWTPGHDSADVGILLVPRLGAHRGALLLEASDALHSWATGWLARVPPPRYAMAPSPNPNPRL